MGEQNANKVKQWLSSAIEQSEAEEVILSDQAVDFDTLTIGKDLPKEYYCFPVNSPHIYQIDKAGEELLKGALLFWFKAVNGSKATTFEKGIIRSIVNESFFKNEVEENNVPFIDVDDPACMKQYTFIISKNSNLAPFKKIESCNIALMLSKEYQETVQCHGGNDVTVVQPGEGGWQPKNEYTLRCVSKKGAGLKFTVQTQMTQYDVEKVNSNPLLSDGIKWDKAFLTERTRNNIQQKDSTAKMKILAVAKQLDGHVLFRILGVTVQSLAPAWVLNLAKGQSYKARVGFCNGGIEYFKNNPET